MEKRLKCVKNELVCTKNELEEEYKRNKDDIDKLKMKSNILESVTLNGKISEFCKMMLFSLIVSLPVTIIVIFLFPDVIIAGGGVAVMEWWRNVIVGSIISGFALERVVSISNNKKLNKFSSAKTEEQKKEELLECRLEIAKLKDKNHAIDKTYSFVSDIETNLSVFNPSFANSDMTYEEQLQNNKKLSDKKTNKEKELEVLTTQEFIHDNFWSIRSKLGKIYAIGMPFVIGGLSTICVVFAGMVLSPTIMFAESTPALNALIGNIFLSSFAAGTGVGAIGTYLRRRQDKRLFNKMNDKLDDNKLPSYSSDYYEELSNIGEKKKIKMNEIVSTNFSYHDSKRELERYIIEEDNNPSIKLITEEKSSEYVNIEEDTLDSNKVEGPRLIKR